MTVAPPQSARELLARARALAGGTFGELAATVGLAPPPSPRRAKGFMGDLLERALGADAGSRPMPDFTALGIELKTIPVSASGKPLESTYVCVASARVPAGERWEDSLVKHKLSQVLWIPIEGVGQTPFLLRRIGWAVLWQPTAQQEQMLRQDWEELTELLVLGQREFLSARLGHALQLRPKAAHGKVTTWATNDEGIVHATLPRGFYLRAWFTHEILQAALAVTTGDST